MRVLILDELYSEPPLDGGNRSLWDLRRSIQDLGHACTVSAHDSVLDGQSWDVVMASRPVLAARVAGRAQRAASRHTVFLGHDLHHQRLAAPDGVLAGQPRPVAAMAAMERHCWSAYDLTLYPNHDEVALVRATGADARWFPYFRIDEVAELLQEPGLQVDHSAATPSQASAMARPLTLLFVGGSSHAPNVTGLRWFANEVLPVLRERCDPIGGSDPADTSFSGVQALVVGRWQTEIREELAEGGLEFVGAVSDVELANLRQQADANIAPLTAGAGLQSKVVEALASGVPLVATSTAMAGIPSAGDVALPGDEPTQWLESLELISSSAEQTRGITTRAARYVHRVHGTDAYLEAVAGILEWRRP